MFLHQIAASLNEPLDYFLMPPGGGAPTLMAFTWVTNAHGPSPQPIACSISKACSDYNDFAVTSD